MKESVAVIHVLEGRTDFVLRQIDKDGPAVRVMKNERVGPPDAKRIAMPELDRAFGRKGWRFTL